MRSLLAQALMVFAVAVELIPTAVAAPTELPIGRYVGYVKLDDVPERIALTVDTFVDQPEDRTQFPKLNAIFRLQLGGYDGAEYVTETFEDIRYDFSNGLLSLDEPDNDLVIAAEVRGLRRITVTGQLWVRSAAASGRVYLEHLSDEPDDDDAGGDDSENDGPFMTSLAGQYEGACGAKRYAMQISTGKGLARDGAEVRGLRGYGVVGMLAEADTEICAGEWCVIRNFSSGHFNFFSGKLILDEPTGSTECRVAGGRMTCRIRTVDDVLSCDLRKTNTSTTPFQVFPRAFDLRTTPQQRAPLPAPHPPEHRELVAALRGNFNGWLHHEALDRYQAFKLNVMPTVSSDNPHNENEVVITATGIQYFGRESHAEGWPQQFDRRSFYLTDGFNLESPNSDGFLQIEDWRQGLIRGVWYSHAYGRVGTVHMIKGSQPPLDPQAKVLAPIAGTYKGPSLDGSQDFHWWVDALLPTQPVGRSHSTLLFEGMMQLNGGLGVRVKIAQGTYDPHTAAVAWLTEERDRPRMVSGTVDRDGRLLLLWPGAPIWGVPLPRYELVPYQRVP